MSDNTNSVNFKAPVITFMGHVDAGKTSLQDAISFKSTTEDGGITQNIGTRFIDKNTVMKIAGSIKGKFAIDERFPGIMMIDTPGHEAFNHMRAQSSSQCDLAVIVVDILAGIKPQTIESINILKENKIPFIIALSKLDRIDGWVNSMELNLRKAIKKNNKTTNILLSYIEDIKWELEKIDVKAKFYFNNKKPNSIYSMIPLSSITKEGTADLIAMISYLTFNWMSKKITFNDMTKASVVKCYKDKKMGWVVETILSNGYINIGDEFMMCNHNKPVLCKVKNIMVSYNNKFITVTSAKASSYVKIIGSNLEDIITGTYMFNVNIMGKEKATLKATESISDIWNSFKYSDGGVIVAPSFGELSGSYYQFNKENIGITRCIIGNLSNSLIDRINIILNEKEKKHRVIYYFGGESIDKYKKYIKDKNYKLTIISNSIIYHLVDLAKEYIENSDNTCVEELTEEGLINYPVLCEIVKGCVFNKGGCEEIVIGLEVKQGKLLKNTVIFVNNGSNMINLGKVISLEKNNEPVNEGTIGDKLAVKLSNPDGKSFGRHFEEKDIIVSHLTRDIIDNMKKYYRKTFNKKDWLLVKNLKEQFAII